MHTNANHQPAQFEYRRLADLQPNPRNARTHSPAQLRQIADSIRQFGFNNPIIIDEHKRVLSGHGRLLAAAMLGMERVPTLRVDHMTEADKAAYRIAENRIAENAGWDLEILAAELEFLSGPDIDFDVTITGFNMAEIDLVIQGQGEELDPADEVPERAPDEPVVSQRGDLYELGPHRLLCADALDSGSYRHLLAEQQAEVVFTDPPYNVAINGHVSGLGAISHREFPMARGDLSFAEFVTFLQAAFTLLVLHSLAGAILYICMDWRHLGEILAAGSGANMELKNLCVWVKTNAGMGSLYRSQHELVLVFKAGSAPHINNVELGKHGRYRTNVWTYPGVNTFRAGRDDELRMHPTVKPVAMVADALLDCSKRKGLVLDPFGGSGTTLIAAHKTGRRAYLLELDPGYVDVTIRRWEQLTGQEARHVASGLTFSALATTRLSVPAAVAADSPEVRHD